MLGKVQFEVQKLVDSYRSNIVSTITNPSQILCTRCIHTYGNVKHTLFCRKFVAFSEEMKRQCDEKREVYEYMVAQKKEKERSKRGKGESFTLQKIQLTRDQYDEDASHCVFRLKSEARASPKSSNTSSSPPCCSGFISISK